MHKKKLRSPICKFSHNDAITHRYVRLTLHGSYICAHVMCRAADRECKTLHCAVDTLLAFFHNACMAMLVSYLRYDRIDWTMSCSPAATLRTTINTKTTLILISSRLRTRRWSRDHRRTRPDHIPRCSKSPVSSDGATACAHVSDHVFGAREWTLAH